MPKINYFFTSLIKTLRGILTTKGDLLTFGTTETRLGVGDNNQLLVADSAQALGLKWADRRFIIGMSTADVPTGADEFYYPYGGIVGGGTDVTARECNLTVGAILSNYVILVTINTRDTNDIMKVTDAGVAGNLAVTISSSTTGTFSDTTNTDTLALAARFSYFYDFGGGAGSLTFRSMATAGLEV